MDIYIKSLVLDFVFSKDSQRMSSSKGLADFNGSFLYCYLSVQFTYFSFSFIINLYYVHFLFIFFKWNTV